jgi:hypothetical protein
MDTIEKKNFSPFKSFFESLNKGFFSSKEQFVLASVH